MTYTTSDLRDYDRCDTDTMLDWAANEIDRLTEDNASLREAVQSAHERADHWTEQAAGFAGERDRLQAIVDLWPKTADGVRAVHGAKVWFQGTFNHGWEVTAELVGVYRDANRDWHYIDFDAGNFYGTREAAEKARDA